MKTVLIAALALAVLVSSPSFAGYRAAPRIQFPFQALGATPAKVDLRPVIKQLGLHIRDQGNRGTCSVFATTFLIEFRTAQMNRTMLNLNLSEEFLNWAKNAANHTETDGGYFSDIIKGYGAYGMVTQNDMPNKPTFDASHPDTPSNSAIMSARSFPRFRINFIKQWNNQIGMSPPELDAVKAELAAGRPVATGIWWLTTFETVTVDHVPLLKEYPRSDNNHSDPSKNPMFDGHSIDLVGYHEGSQFPGGGYFIFRNSFGNGFGDDGYGFVSFKYLRDYSNDAITVDPAPPTFPSNGKIFPTPPNNGQGSKANPHF